MFGLQILSLFTQITEVKRNIRKFCGFAFKASEPEYEKKKQHLNKYVELFVKFLKQNICVGVRWKCLCSQ